MGRVIEDLKGLQTHTTKLNIETNETLQSNEGPRRGRQLLGTSQTAPRTVSGGLASGESLREGSRDVANADPRAPG